MVDVRRVPVPVNSLGDDELRYEHTTILATGEPAISVLGYGRILMANRLLSVESEEVVVRALSHEIDALFRDLRDVFVREFMAARRELL